MTREELEDAILRAELELDQALEGALEKLELVGRLREQVTDEGSRRCGWGLSLGQRHFYKALIELLEAAKAHATERGGGITTDQQRLLERVRLIGRPDLSPYR